MAISTQSPQLQGQDLMWKDARSFVHLSYSRASHYISDTIVAHAARSSHFSRKLNFTMNFNWGCPFCPQNRITNRTSSRVHTLQQQLRNCIVHENCGAWVTKMLPSSDQCLYSVNKQASHYVKLFGGNKIGNLFSWLRSYKMQCTSIVYMTTLWVQAYKFYDYKIQFFFLVAVLFVVYFCYIARMYVEG
jgi:hypothetical protein